MSYDRRVNQNSFRIASKKYDSRLAFEGLDNDLQMTASRIMAMRKAAEAKNTGDEAAKFKSTETLFEDEKNNSVARTKADFGPCKIHIGNEVSGGAPSVSLALKKIVAHLDRIADYCQNNGEKELAKQIDMISNTIEKENN